MKRLLRAAQIIGTCILFACAFGILHDQVTARVCLKYFTEFHIDLGLAPNPTNVALVWGVIATWWVGLLLGILLALACTVGQMPMLAVRDLRKPLAWLFLTMATGALLFGIVGYFWGAGVGRLAFPQIQDWTEAEQARFAADLFAHNASYGFGFFGGMAVVVWALVVRIRRMTAKPTYM